MIVGRALLLVDEDVIGADDLPEFLAGGGVAGIEIRVSAFDGATECGPELFCVVARQRAEQIVQRLHWSTCKLLLRYP